MHTVHVDGCALRACCVVYGRAAVWCAKCLPALRVDLLAGHLYLGAQQLVEHEAEHLELLRHRRVHRELDPVVDLSPRG
jgi:hypothetical protein